MRVGQRFMAVLAIAILVVVAPCVVAQTVQSATDDPALYAVGALGASNLYTSYFLLGTLADGYATAAYTAEFADELARDVIGLNESAIEVLRELNARSALAGADRQLVEDMIAAHEKLIEQAFGLLAYVADSSDTGQWFSARREAWEMISELLDIQ